MRVYEPNWYHSLSSEYNKAYYKELEIKIAQDRKAGKLILPLEDRIFRAFELCPLDKVKLVIIGQDPYLSLKQATGLAFSVPVSEVPPPSLRNILKELKSDTGNVKADGDLTNWAVQGVLLLNTVLTVEAGKSASHAGYGWETFTDSVIKILAKQGRPLVYCLWGKHAQRKKELINLNSSAPTLIIESPHPSPLAAHTGFFWSKPFTKSNEFLASHNIQPIDWSK